MSTAPCTHTRAALWRVLDVLDRPPITRDLRSIAPLLREARVPRELTMPARRALLTAHIPEVASVDCPAIDQMTARLRAAAARHGIATAPLRSLLGIDSVPGSVIVDAATSAPLRLTIHGVGHEPDGDAPTWAHWAPALIAAADRHGLLTYDSDTDRIDPRHRSAAHLLAVTGYTDTNPPRTTAHIAREIRACALYDADRRPALRRAMLGLVLALADVAQ